jgi:hypothetical protein
LKFILWDDKKENKMKSNKRTAVAFAAAALCLGVAGNAMAAFEYGDLTRYIYDTNASKEVGSDLGVTTALVATPVANIDAINLNALGLTSPSTSRVGYFSYDNTIGALYVTGAAGLTNYQVNAIQAMDTAITSVQDNYNLFANNTVITTGTNYSYFRNLDKNGVTPGQLANTLTGGNMDLSLANLAAAGSLTQSLYYFDVSNGGKVVGTEVAQVITNLDGSTTIAALPGNVAATPIPAAFYLMGSGLMGLVGLRRKKA